MKKPIILLCLCMMLAVIFAGCSAQTTTPETSSQQEETKEDMENPLAPLTALEFSVTKLCFTDQNIEISYPEVSFAETNQAQSLINERILGQAIAFGTEFDLVNGRFVADIVDINPFGTVLTTLFSYEYSNSSTTSIVTKSYFTVNINIDTGEIFATKDIVAIDSIAERIKNHEGYRIFDMDAFLADTTSAQDKEALLLEQTDYLESMSVEELTTLLEQSYFSFAAIKHGGTVQAFIPAPSALGDFIALSFDW